MLQWGSLTSHLDSVLHGLSTFFFKSPALFHPATLLANILPFHSVDEFENSGCTCPYVFSFLHAAAAAASVVSDSVQPHRRQPIRLPRPWDSPGKNTGVGCHFLLQCRKVKSESEVAQSCPTFSNPMDCSLPGSSIHGIFQARALE